MRLFRVVDRESDIAAGPVFTGAKLPLQGKKLALQIGEERGRARLLALAFDGPTGSAIQRLKVGDAGEQVVMPWRHRWFLQLRCSRHDASSSSRR